MLKKPAQNFSGSWTSRTIGDACLEARRLLNDPVPDVMPTQGANQSGLISLRTFGQLITEARGLLSDTDPYTTGNDSDGWSGTTTHFTIADCISEARTMLNDTMPVGGGTYRYSDADLYTYFNQAMLFTKRQRPDLFPNLGAHELPVFAPPQAGTVSPPFPISEIYYPLVTKYVVGNAQLRDDTWNADGKGMALLQGYLEAILRGPFRYTDEFLFEQANDAILYIRRLRPDLFISSDQSGMRVYTAAEDEDTLFPIAEYYYQTVKSFMVGRAKLRDAMYTVAQKPDPEEAALEQGFIEMITKGPARYADRDLFNWATEALGVARRLRPDMFLGYLRQPLPVYDPACDADAPFPIDDAYFNGFVSYIIGRAKGRDEDVGKDSEPDTYLALYTAALTKGV